MLSLISQPDAVEWPRRSSYARRLIFGLVCVDCVDVYFLKTTASFPLSGPHLQHLLLAWQRTNQIASLSWLARQYFGEQPRTVSRSHGPDRAIDLWIGRKSSQPTMKPLTAHATST